MAVIVDNVQHSSDRPAFPFHKAVPRTLDALARDHTWTAEKQDRLDALRRFKPTRAAAVVASAKNEGIYILEWLAHQRAVGFGHVFLYTNDNRDGSYALLDLLARHGLVTVLHNDVGPDVSPQVKAYEHSIQYLPELRDFAWAGYFDLDEFLVPSSDFDHSVVALLRAAEARYPRQPPGAVHVHWRWFGSSGRVERTPGLVHEQFTHSAPHGLVKSLVRMQDVRSMRRIHVPELIESFGVDSSLRPIELSEEFTSDPQYAGAQLNHYYHKSYAEFCVKHDRGEGHTPGGRTGKPMDTFFRWDVPVASSTSEPMPDALRARVRRELDALHALPGMAAVLRHVEERHRRLESQLIGDGPAADHGRNLPLPALAARVPATCRPDLGGEHYLAVMRRLHDVLRPQSYLEVGGSDGSTLALAQCASIAVDPAFQIGPNLAGLLERPVMSFHRTTSDAFFAQHDPATMLGAPLDMAFLDGLHQCEALLRDFAHTERACQPYGLILMHDCLPVEVAIATRTPGEMPATMPHRQGWWAGDVWRTALLLRRVRPDLDINVLDADPTGLVLVTNLSPGSTALLDNYDAYVAEMLSWNLAEIGLDRLYDEFRVQPAASLATPGQIRARYRI